MSKCNYLSCFSRNFVRFDQELCSWYKFLPRRGERQAGRQRERKQKVHYFIIWMCWKWLILLYYSITQITSVIRAFTSKGQGFAFHLFFFFLYEIGILWLKSTLMSCRCLPRAMDRNFFSRWFLMMLVIYLCCVVLCSVLRLLLY